MTIEGGGGPWFILALLFVGTVAINPIGFMGGGWDDWQYLDAARCWREYGPCLPHNHWQGRWPVIAPIALLTSLFGESRLSVGLAPLIASLWCLILLVFIGNRIFRPPVGFFAAGLLLCTSAFAIQILDPAVEATELALVLGGVMALLQWRRSKSPIWPALAGLCFGLAFQVRETAVVAALFAAMYVASRHCVARPHVKLLAAAIFALPFLVEALSFFVMTGDPLYRRRLSLNHARIQSSELLGPVDYNHSALFNPNYIANWRREPGIHVHWSIDGLLNLFVNAKGGLALMLIPALVLTYRRTLAPGVIKAIAVLYGISLLYICVVIYALALDPKARMMFVPIAGLSLALALLLVSLIDTKHRLVAGVSAGAAIGVGFFILFIHPRVFPIEKPAAAWIAAAPGQVEIDENTRRHLALVPDAQQLPPLAGKRPMFLVKVDVRCEVWAVRSRLDDDVMLIHRQVMSRASMFDDRWSGELCLFRLARPITRQRLVDGVAEADWYKSDARRRTKPGLAIR